ncbi:RHS repeat-associated core domain-containing protein [Flavobacterium sp. CS20]|nr:RHS repeat-associated core domain-containing protein [Flavobacterium sp. CS20]
MENASVVKNNSYQLDYTYDDDGGLIAGSNYGYTQPHAVREIKEQPTGVNCCDSQDDPRIKNQNIKHDANGNLTKVIEGIGEEEITKIHYLWDEENRLMAVDLNPYSEESDHPIATYTYDAGGERIIKYLYQQVDIHSNAKDVGNARKTETYIYPDGMITTKVLKFIVRDQALSYTKHYHIGSQRVASKIGTSERFGFYSKQIIPLANLANADGINLIDVLQDPDEDGQNFNHLNERRNRILQAFDIPPLESETVDISEDENVTTSSNNFAHGYAGDLQHVEVFYFHSDHLGSSNYVSNYDGDISQHAEYLPFGELLTDEHLNSHNTRYKYNGKEFDQETGNYYYGARYYNPKNSLWLSVDPLAEKYPSWSPYNYTMNNPVRYVDPTGMVVEDPIYGKNFWGNLKYLGDDGTNNGRVYFVSGQTKRDVKNATANGEFYSGDLSSSDEVSSIPSQMIFSVDQSLQSTLSSNKENGGHSTFSSFETTQWDEGPAVTNRDLGDGRREVKGSVQPFVVDGDKLDIDMSNLDVYYHIHPDTQGLGSSTPSNYSRNINGRNIRRGDIPYQADLERSGYNGNPFVVGARDNRVNFYNGRGSVMKVKYQQFKITLLSEFISHLRF